MDKRHFLLACAAALALPARADGPDLAPRPFPAHARRGRMTPGYAPDIYIDGKLRQLAPSSRIFNEDNLIEVPAALRGRDLPVHYTVDRDGLIDRVWLLTREEARLPAPSGR